MMRTQCCVACCSLPALLGLVMVVLLGLWWARPVAVSPAAPAITAAAAAVTWEGDRASSAAATTVPATGLAPRAAAAVVPRPAPAARALQR